MKQAFFSSLTDFFHNQAKQNFRLAFSVSMLFLLATMKVSLANAHNHKNDKAFNMAESVSISESWARATFALAKTGAAYFSVSNSGDKMVVIESVSLSPSFAMMAELHTTVMENDMMQMQELSEGIKIKPGDTVEFSPGGKHIMIMGLEGPLQKGKSIIITLHFEDGSSKEQLFPIVDKRN